MKIGQFIASPQIGSHHPPPTTPVHLSQILGEFGSIEGVARPCWRASDLDEAFEGG